MVPGPLEPGHHDVAPGVEVAGGAGEGLKVHLREARFGKGGQTQGARQFSMP